MEALVRCCAAESWPARVVAVISNRPDAAGLECARAFGIATAVVDHRAHATREAFDQALRDAVAAYAPDLVALAGFMRVLGPAFVQAWSGRLLNIHPSLLPAFPGLHTHRRALDAGCKVAGATVHFVTEALDHGPIVIQSAVPVRPDDSEDILAARVLTTEHLIYPRAVRWFVEGALELDAGRVRQRDGQAQCLMVPDTPAAGG